MADREVPLFLIVQILLWTLLAVCVFCAVLSALKGRWILFLLGFPFALFWIMGAIREPSPGSYLGRRAAEQEVSADGNDVEPAPGG